MPIQPPKALQRGAQPVLAGRKAGKDKRTVVSGGSRSRPVADPFAELESGTRQQPAAFVPDLSDERAAGNLRTHVGTNE